jgi:predicted Ser/Thr protein kinase
METNTVTLTREEYNNLMYTKFVYDFVRAEKIRNKKTGGYLNPEDKTLYRIEESEVE